MKNVYIKYNPYTVETEITIDGKKVKEGSNLNIIKGTRLQEYVDSLPKRLRDECYDANFKITFHGTKADFEDLKIAFNAASNDSDTRNRIRVENLCLEEQRSVDEAEQEIDKIFEEILNSPYSELHTDEVVKAFQDAKSQEFYVNVVATMSSGKSTLINAILGKELMPVANKAKTAVIVYIENDDDAKDFSAVVFNKDGKCIEERSAVDRKDMNRYNDNPDVCKIHLKGNIPIIKNSKIKLVLVDTPGVNNSHDESHREKTYDLLMNSEHSIVLYVMNQTQLEIKDDNDFLRDVCEQMKKKGKQSKDRFIFAVNKCDEIKLPNDESVSKVLSNVQEYLAKHGINDANIFPVSASVASELRMGISPEDSINELSSFAKKINKYPNEYNFNSYTQFSHLPKSAQNNIDAMLASAEKNKDENKKLEIFSGITAIEESIFLYIDKYARTIKIKDLIEAFDGKLKCEELKARIVEAISKEKTIQEQANKTITECQKKVGDGESVKEVLQKIKNKDFVKEFSEKMENLTLDVNSKLAEIIRRNQDTKILKTTAEKIISGIQIDIKNLIAKMKTNLRLFFSDTIQNEYQVIIQEYKDALSKLSLDSKIGSVNFDLGVLANVDSFIKKVEISDTYIKKVDEGGIVKEKIVVESSFLRKWFHWLPFVDEKAYEVRERWVKNEKEYVDIKNLTKNELEPIQTELVRLTKNIIADAQKQFDCAKKKMEEEVLRVNGLIANAKQSWFDEFNRYKNSEEAIAKNNQKLQFIENIQKRVKSII